jgi:hypothetical protein
MPLTLSIPAILIYLLRSARVSLTCHCTYYAAISGWRFLKEAYGKKFLVSILASAPLSCSRMMKMEVILFQIAAFRNARYISM